MYDLEKGGVPKKLARATKKDRNFGKNFSEYFIDYSNNTSIQGIKYLGETRRSIFEKLFWITVLSTSIYLCSYLILQVYRKWQSGPVIVTFSNNLTPVWTVPFPAITICPESKTRKSVYNYGAALKAFKTQPDNMTEEELHHFEQMNFLCGDAWPAGGHKSSGNDTLDFILNVAPTCDEWFCRWNNTIGNTKECNKLLTPVLTDDGLCFTFNMLDGEELFTNSVYYPKKLFNHDVKSTNWSLEKGYYSKVMKSDDYPRRASAGLTLSFRLSIFGYEPDLDYGCRGGIRGYKIILHSPSEIPRLSKNVFMVSFNKQTIVTMEPDMMITSDELQNYDPQKRQCYYSSEKQLQYYKVYTQNNCEIECLTNNTLKMCGCVAFYMPRNHTTAICGPGSTVCMTTAEHIMFAQEMKLDVKYESEMEFRCNCLPSCTYLYYSRGTSEVDYEWKDLLLAKSEYLNVSDYTFTQIFFFSVILTLLQQKERSFMELLNSLRTVEDFLDFSWVVRLFRNYGCYFWSGAPKIHIADEIPRRIVKLPLRTDVIPGDRATVIDLEG